MSDQIDWPYLLAFGALLLIALSSATTLWLARVFANRDLDEPAPGRAWERCTTRDDTGMFAYKLPADVGYVDVADANTLGTLGAFCHDMPTPSDDTQPTPALPKDEK